MCEYQGYEFGANYPDSVCIDGFLWDADSGQSAEDGWTYDHGGDLPCPSCNHDDWLRDAAENVEEEGAIAGSEGKPSSDCPYTEGSHDRFGDGDSYVFRYVWFRGWNVGRKEWLESTKDTSVDISGLNDLSSEHLVSKWFNEGKQSTANSEPKETGND